MGLVNYTKILPQYFVYFYCKYSQFNYKNFIPGLNPSAAAATFSLQISKNSIFHLLPLNEILQNLTLAPKIRFSTPLSIFYCMIFLSVKNDWMTFDPQFWRARYETSERTLRITDKSVIWEAFKDKDSKMTNDIR